MTNIIMHGCNGKMGQTISRIVEEDGNAKIVAGVDPFDGITNSYPVFKSIKDCDVEADVVIDFSSAKAADELMDYCEAKKLPLVLCTTGLTPEQIARAEKLADAIPVLRSANMSVGINLLEKVLQEVSQTLADAGFDIEIVEKHHKLKKDAPSGTALALADAVSAGLTEKYDYVYDRSQRSIQRPEKEIGLSAVRGGTIVGDHDVIFAGEDEVITFSHRAYSKAVFGKGAVEAAKFINGKAAGLYTMSDVIG
ncbi:MAG: 4-hydroxy-tetrahydrodipicolinate reductase [Lachnospiraceae bacterium]|nr:4-hydroxy-tetrahydrodipicolinate reductase [Lachnospiraceae bacterium]